MKDMAKRDSSQNAVKVLDNEGVKQLQSMLYPDETTTAASGEFAACAIHLSAYVIMHALIILTINCTLTQELYP